MGGPLNTSDSRALMRSGNKISLPIAASLCYFKMKHSETLPRVEYMAESVPGVITFLAEPLVSTYGPPLLVVTMGIFVKFLLARLHFVERAFYSGLDLIWASLGITLAKLTATAQ